jgi:hypothetical protein
LQIRHDFLDICGHPVLRLRLEVDVEAQHQRKVSGRITDQKVSIFKQGCQIFLGTTNQKSKKYQKSKNQSTMKYTIVP